MPATGKIGAHVSRLVPVHWRTAHRRFAEWVTAGVMTAVHQATVDVLGAVGRSTRRGRASTACTCGRSKEEPDRAQPGRPGQARLQDSRDRRPQRAGVARGHLCGHCCIEPTSRSLAARLPARSTAHGPSRATDRANHRPSPSPTARVADGRQGFSGGFTALETLDRSMQQCHGGLGSLDATVPRRPHLDLRASSAGPRLMAAPSDRDATGL